MVHAPNGTRAKWYTRQMAQAPNDTQAEILYKSFLFLKTNKI
jgi:hypothetical protein